MKVPWEDKLPCAALALLVLAVFYGIYFAKMLAQKQLGIQTRQIGRRREKDIHTVEVLMSMATLGAPIAQLLSIAFGWSHLPANARFTGFCIGMLGDVIFLLSVLCIKDSWRAGIPDKDKTELVTTGIYAFSRNPAFLGFDLMYIGVLLLYGNLLTLGFGVGIGSGVVSEGQLLISRPGRPVGHIGHMLISDNKRVCVCGFRGCLEAYSGGNSLVQVAHERFPARTDFTDARAIDLAAGAGDADARSILDTAAVYNAAGIASMIQLYVPDAIIFGGGQCREDGYLYRRTLEEIRNILPRERLENIKVSITTLGKYQSALGAARLAYEKFFGETK